MKLPQYPQTNQILQIKVKESRPHTLFFGNEPQKIVTKLFVTMIMLTLNLLRKPT